MVRPMKRLLIADDDLSLGKFLSRELRRREFLVEVSDGRAASARVESADYDLLLMDMHLAGMDGLELLRRVRAQRPIVPVMVLTAAKSTNELVQAFENGADDFLAKPFSFQELMARMQRMLQRQASLAESSNVFRIGDLTVNPEEYSVFRRDRRIDLTPREFTLLGYMIQHVGKVVSRKALMQDVWQMPQESSTNVVDVYMKYLRDKIDGGEDQKLICTVRGIGYRLIPERSRISASIC
jgi:DNA-binding response OmpR family regulator